MGRTHFFRKFAFLFYQYKYGSSYLALLNFMSSLLLAFAPVTIHHYVVGQAFVLGFIVLVSHRDCYKCEDTSTEFTNFVDAATWMNISLVIRIVAIAAPTSGCMESPYTLLAPSAGLGSRMPP